MSELYPRKRPQEAIDRLVAHRVANTYGVFSREFALNLGATHDMIEWRLATGRWDRLSRGVYRLAGVPSSWLQSLYAECLGWGEWSLVSHRAAAALFDLPNFEPGPPELIVPRGRHRVGSKAITHQMSTLDAVDRTVMHHIPVTTPARTLIDLAVVSSPDLVEEALDDALRRKLVSVPRLRWRLAELAQKGRPGVAVFRALLEARQSAVDVPASVLETRLLRLIRRARLPRPEIQYEVRDRGRLVAVPDFAYPERRLAIEADGYRWHSSRARWQRDLDRRNALTVLGWSIVHVTWEQLTRRPDDVVDRIRSALQM